MRHSGFPWTFVVLAVLVVAVFTTGIMVCVPPLQGADEPGHLQCAAFLFCERRLPRPEDGVLLQHPPLYYAALAAALGVLPTDAVADWIKRSGRTELELPYEKRVAVDLVTTNGAPRRCYQVREIVPRPVLVCVSTYPIPEAVVILWRSIGLLALLVTAAFLIGCMKSVGRADPPLAGLVSAATLLVPGFGMLFGTVTNDQFAVLFSVAGTGILLGAGYRGGAPTARRALAAGVLLGAAMLSKATALGPLAGSAAWIMVTCGPGWRARARTLLLVALPPVGALCWFLFRFYAMTGSFDVGRTLCEGAPVLMRDVLPDASGHADAVAAILTSWFGSVGNDSIAPSRILVLASLWIPALAIGGAFFTLLSRPAGDRVGKGASAAFLAAVGVQLAATVANNRYGFFISARYFQPLAALGAAALFFGARTVLGGRARRVLAAAVTALGVMGADLLHRQVIPFYYPPRDRFESPDFVAYVDPGSPTSARFVERGAPRREGAWGPKPEGSVAWDPAEVRIRVPNLDPAGAYVAWIRLHGFGRSLSIEDFAADGLPLGGPHSPSGVAGWLRFPIPRGATRDGSVTVSARTLVGEASIAELLVTRLPIEVGEAEPTGDGVAVTLRSRAPERLPALTAALRGQDPAPASRPVVFGPDGSARLAFAGARLPSELLLTELETSCVDLKLAPFATSMTDQIGSIDSPGMNAARVPETRAVNALLVSIPELPLPSGEYSVVLLDERSRALPPGRVTIAFPDGTRQDAAEARFTIREGAGKGPALALLHGGGAPYVLDRLTLRRARSYSFDLPAR